MPLPPAFDPATYRALNPDLSALDDAQALAHWQAEGRAAGRIASPLATREALLSHIAAAATVLEIGPFCRPLLTGPQVEYLDVLDAQALRARAVSHGLDPAGCPPHIHHVGDLAQVDRTYHAVVSSHAIEHQPDLVRHLNEVERVLAPGGAFYLLVPDKRYCFDHFLPETSIAQVMQAHAEGRRVHSLASVIEHGALTTHNDSGRHWAGDHGAPPADRAAAVAAALSRHGAAEGGYVDVHAWQFTPDSFREMVTTLNALGLIGLEVAEVYDTVAGRNEFAAVLRADPAAASRARSRASAIPVVAMQTADPVRYAPMLAASQPNVAEFCRRHGHRYQAFIGVKRGFHPWQATYNRIPMLADLAATGFRGWALYLDADAWVADLDFDLLAYLDRHSDRAAILATAGVTDQPWDVNAGVVLVNLGHPLGRRLVDRWQAMFDAIPDERLRAAEAWLDDDNDQDLLHRLLRDDPELMAAVRIEPRDFMNSPHGRFIRQHLRAQSPHLPARIRAVAGAAADAMRLGGAAPPVPATPLDERWRWRLAHPTGHEPVLARAAVPPPDTARAARAIAAWNEQAERPVPRPHQEEIVAALDAADRDRVAGILAELGAQPIGQGIAGGAQQHVRAHDPVFAHRLALWTHDRMVSLAEAVGALPAESPEAGPWGENSAHEPAALRRMIEQVIGFDLAGPAAMGGQLGVDTGGGVVLHQRMLDAAYLAWRLRGILADRPSARIVELGGGAGFGAHYAARAGLAAYAIAAPPVLRAVQAYLVDAGAPGPCDMLVSTDEDPGGGDVAALLGRARALGAGLVLSIHPASSGVAPDGWRCVSRHRHWLRAGHVETLWSAA